MLVSFNDYNHEQVFYGYLSLPAYVLFSVINRTQQEAKYEHTDIGANRHTDKPDTTQNLTDRGVGERRSQFAEGHEQAVK